MQGWTCCMSPSGFWESQFAFVLETKILHRKSLKQRNLCFCLTSKTLVPPITFFWLLNFWVFLLRNSHFCPCVMGVWQPCMGLVMAGGERLFNGRSVCSVMGEGYIRRKLGNSRIGGAITADIRALNHPTIPTSHLPSLSSIAPRPPPSVSCVWHRSGSKDLNGVRTAAWAVDKPGLISQHLNAPLKLDTLTTPQ